MDNNSIIASHEDDALNNYLDSRDSDACEVCETEKGTIEFDDMFMCQSCYEDACEHAEMRCEMEQED
jgi:hypothetical protein